MTLLASAKKHLAEFDKHVHDPDLHTKTQVPRQSRHLHHNNDKNPLPSYHPTPSTSRGGRGGRMERGGRQDLTQRLERHHRIVSKDNSLVYYQAVPDINLLPEIEAKVVVKDGSLSDVRPGGTCCTCRALAVDATPWGRALAIALAIALAPAPQVLAPFDEGKGLDKGFDALLAAAQQAPLLSAPKPPVGRRPTRHLAVSVASISGVGDCGIGAPSFR